MIGAPLADILMNAFRSPTSVGAFGLGVGTVHRLKAKERIRRLMRNAAPWPKDAELT